MELGEGPQQPDQPIMYLFIGVARYYVSGRVKKNTFYFASHIWDSVTYEDWTYRDAFWLRSHDGDHLGIKGMVKVHMLCLVS